jgi:signal transduction histidine kinase
MAVPREGDSDRSRRRDDEEVDTIAVTTARDRPRSGARDLTSALTRQSMLVAAVCVLADVIPMLIGQTSALRPQDWAVVVMIVLADAFLALPARFSGWVAVVHGVLQVVAAGVTAGSSLALNSEVGALIAAYRAGAWLRGGPAWTALAVLALGNTASRLIAGPDISEIILLTEVAKTALLPWLVGRYTTTRRGYIAELEQRAEVQDRESEIAVEHAIASERSAIARDLHDVISHHVSTINVHAGAARLALDTSSDRHRAAQSLSAVETSSRAAMLDLRRLLDLLHSEHADATRQPGLNDLEELLDGVRRAGLPITLTTHGSPQPLPDSVDIAIYRITQEMLTNAQRHGNGTPIDIEVRYTETTISVSARNPIPPIATGHEPDSQSNGRGLAGMRQRSAMFGGTVRYGPDGTGHHWETVATFPIGQGEPR